MKERSAMITFEKWMENNPNHKYTDATIKRYTRALDKAEEWLNITLPSKILDITDYRKRLILGRIHLPQ